MTEELLALGGTTLVRARLDDRPAVEKLQFTAYALNRELLGVEPQPLQADYVQVFKNCEVWVKRDSVQDRKIEAVLILETARSDTKEDDLLIWNVSTSPDCQQKGLGNALLKCAEQRARELGRNTIRLYTGQRLTHLVAWYSRNGYAVERLEELPDREVVHMIKHLD